MRALKTFLLGSLAAGVVAYALAAALAVSAQVDGRRLKLGLGPLPIVSVTEDRAATETTFGPGLAGLAVAGGVANLAAAHAIRRRSGRRRDHVD